ncbi:LOW QUALITY PROTEIN: hypothetical protein MC885_000023 [Smutsia gigantea]|nr:LOW QUALITY PROTEIN: hypothetical protein MC885_000023 [Smutsia gigantea]
MTSGPACTWRGCFHPAGLWPARLESLVPPGWWCEREGLWNQAESGQKAGACGLRNSASVMALMKVEDALLSVVVFEREPENKVNLAELFEGKNSVLFGVPGALTSGCCKTHLPGFVQQARVLMAKGVQVVTWPSVNVVFGRADSTEGKVRLLADSTAAFGKETDLLLDSWLVSLFGNPWLKRVSMDGVVKSLNVELDDTGLTYSLTPSSSEALSPGSIAMVTLELSAVGLQSSNGRKQQKVRRLPVGREGHDGAGTGQSCWSSLLALLVQL